METIPVKAEASSTVLLPTASLSGPSSFPSIFGLPEADIQCIAQAVAIILKEPKTLSYSLLVAGPSSVMAPPIGKSFSSIIAEFVSWETLMWW